MCWSSHPQVYTTTVYSTTVHILVSLIRQALPYQFLPLPELKCQCLYSRVLLSPSLFWNTPFNLSGFTTVKIISVYFARVQPLLVYPDSINLGDVNPSRINLDRLKLGGVKLDRLNLHIPKPTDTP